MIEYWHEGDLQVSYPAGGLDSGSRHCYIEDTLRMTPLLVQGPEHWTERDFQAFVHLLNHGLPSRYRVVLHIVGNMAVTDPGILIVPMDHFKIMLLRQLKAQGNQGKALDFFDEHPLTE